MSLSRPSSTLNPLQKLDEIRAAGNADLTPGLPRDIVLRFAAVDASLRDAIDAAWLAWQALSSEFPEEMAQDEATQIRVLQHGLVNFYRRDAVNPFVSLAARGPWIITTKGAIIHDSGGYGMLGMGHAPPAVLAAMNQPHVMANVMSANFSQLRFLNALRAEIGHQRGHCPFSGFVCLNSGSEAVTMAARVADMSAKRATDAGGSNAGQPIYGVALRGAFHGRTGRPASYSDSSLATYKQHLASFRDYDRLLTVEPNNIDELRAAFARADRNGWFIETMFIEPVMGEGNPGMALQREFYDEARKLTKHHGALLLVDSIQAGLRATGTLSVVDYPGFEDCEAPDMETYSKALNAGQFPLSVLAMNESTAQLYRTGIYGNTMTTNPRALDVACSVLEMVTPELRANIRARGAELVDKLSALAAQLDGAITHVQGTGLLVSCELDPQRFANYGANSAEEYMRQHGIGVIHGGANALRFTPHFAIGSEEIDLLVEVTRQALVHGPTLN